MNRAELLELIANRENSRVEFKRDNCHPDDLAREMSALLNLEGGVILLGVENDGQISGLTRDREDAEEWLMNIARNNLQPATIPVWTSMPMEDGKVIGVVELPADSPGKPYKAKQGKTWVTQIRAGSTSRAATREEEGRLYQAARLVRYELRAVPDMSLESLDINRLENYLSAILQRSVPDQADSWRRFLLNSDLLVTVGDRDHASVAGTLLFSRDPNRRLPQAGVTAVAFPGTKKDYNTVDEERIRGPLTPVVSPRAAMTQKTGMFDRDAVVDRGVIERTVDFVTRNMGSTAWLEGARRHRKGSFPLDAVREAVVNAVVHRDYTREGTDIEVSLYSDRLEIISPGRLPNGVTVEKMREGVVRVARNELLKEILRDYRYIEHQGMGVRNRIIESMRLHNGMEPDLVEEDARFTIRLWKEQHSA